MVKNFNILERIDNYFNKISQLSHNEFLGENNWEYFPTNLELFKDILNIIKKREININGKKFLDVGSGIGNLCYIATLIGFDAEGIELNPILFDISKQIYPEIKFINLDIYDFNKYYDYDIIYYFAPFKNIKLQEELKEKIENSVKVGTYISTIGTENKDDRFINIGNKGHLWLKIKE